MSLQAILVEIDVVSPGGAAETLRFCDQAIRPMPPADADRPNVPWDDRIIEAPSLRRALFDDLDSLAPSLGVGVLKLANAGGALDAYQAYTWEAIRVWRWREGTAFSAAVQVYAGVCGPVGFGGESRRILVPLYDYTAELDRPLQATTYAGTNGVGGVLYEGEAGGLKGRVKPLAFGNLLYAHLPAPQVNYAVEGHQLHDGAIQGEELVFERGHDAGLVDDGNYVGAAFDAAAPAAAHYAADLTRGLIKMNHAPAGTLTFGCKGDNAGGYVETPGPVAARILARAGVPGGRIGASVAGLADTAVVGAWVPDSANAREVLAYIAKATLAAFMPGRNGVWEAIPFGAPAGVAAHTIEEDEVFELLPDQTAPAPVGEVKVGWGRLYNPFQPGELAAGIRGTVYEEQLTTEYKWAKSAAATVKARFPRSWRTLELQTALRFEGAAQTLADNLKALFSLRPDSRPRQMWRATVELTDARLAVALGTTVQLTYPPNGVNDRFVLIAEEPFRPRRDQAVWTLWG